MPDLRERKEAGRLTHAQRRRVDGVDRVIGMYFRGARYDVIDSLRQRSRTQHYFSVLPR